MTTGPERKWNRHGPSIRDVTQVVKDAQSIQCGLPDGRWVPARSLGSNSRLRAAWLVFTGRADALLYPGQEIQ